MKMWRNRHFHTWKRFEPLLGLFDDTFLMQNDMEEYSGDIDFHFQPLFVTQSVMFRIFQRLLYGNMGKSRLKF